MTAQQVIPDFESLDVEAKWNGIKSIRNDLLLKSDWTQLVDVSLSSESRHAWQQYRQQLREITSAYSDPSDVVFPDQPDTATSTNATVAEQIEAVELMIDLILDTQESA